MFIVLALLSSVSLHCSASLGRVIELNSTGFNELVRRRMESVPTDDASNEIYTPDLDDPLKAAYETIPEIGRIELGEVLHVSANSVEYAVRNHTNLALRYMHDCREDGIPVTPHPNLKLMWYADEAISAGLNLTWIPLFVSPPVPMPLVASGKARFSLTPSQQTSCRISGATVRFAVLSVRETEDVRILMRADLSMPRTHRYVLGMQLGIKLIRHLQLLHSRNILHGDMHPGYARIVRIPQGVQFVLDNSGVSSSWILPDGFSEDPIIPAHSATFLSPWELMFRSYTKRDEIFRAILTIANWICYYDYEVVQSIMPIDAMINWKFYGNIFVVPEKHGVGVILDPLNELSLTPDSLAYIRGCFERIMKLARGDDIANPQYDLLIEEMRNIVARILEPPAMTESKKRKSGFD
jgi:hypothetical protein